METRLNAKIAALERANAAAQNGLVESVNSTIKSNFNNLRAEIKKWMNAVPTVVPTAEGSQVSQVSQVEPDTTYFDGKIEEIASTLKQVAQQLQILNKINVFFPDVPPDVEVNPRKILTFSKKDAQIYDDVINSLAQYFPRANTDLEQITDPHMINPLWLNREIGRASCRERV